MSDNRQSGAALTDGLAQAEPPSQEVTQTGNSSNLDLLRTLAVSAVFFDHLFHDTFGIDRIGPIALTSLGRSGVLIFFVHTTLVLLRSMRRSAKRGRALFADFYIRRLFRIYPLSVAVVLIVITFHIPWAVREQFQWYGWRVVAENLLLIQNLPQDRSVTGPLWSLPYEVQMYIVLPVVFAIAQRGRLFSLLLWAGGVALLIAIWALHWEHLRLLLLFVPCFVSGALAYRAPGRMLPGFLWPFAALALLLLQSLMPPGTATDVSGWLICAALGLAIPMFSELESAVIGRVTGQIAKYSYGIYLSHVPVMWLCFRSLELPVALRWVLFVILILTIPIGLFFAIESPLILLGKRMAEGYSVDETRRVHAGTARA
jgi:peptidoglycan/LPS O-acetylase OafA/YrhL